MKDKLDDDAYFEALLRRVLSRDFDLEIEELIAQADAFEKSGKTYVFSDRHNKRMAEIFAQCRSGQDPSAP